MHPKLPRVFDISVGRGDRKKCVSSLSMWALDHRRIHMGLAGVEPMAWYRDRDSTAFKPQSTNNEFHSSVPETSMKHFTSDLAALLNLQRVSKAEFDLTFQTAGLGNIRDERGRVFEPAVPTAVSIPVHDRPAGEQPMADGMSLDSRSISPSQSLRSYGVP